ncbi:MAG: ABC transporter ATP-binding protein [Erysipelotrichia bacterium]|nr:ABC transporter ATP-binding protein [Candidatus Riflebacteria bacterium]NCB37934.1 ABC transporter ATP-binding protein [Erysipelotrichia bacterium]
MINQLTLKNLSIFFDKKPVLENLTCEFRSGSVNLVVGRAGSGKSTLLKTLSGFHREYSGQILADGDLFRPSGNFSLAFQDPESLFFNPTVAEEVGFALKMRGQSEEQISQQSREWLLKWGLDPAIYFNRHPLELSGGEKRRVALAACTVFMPPVILLDEPLAGLDAAGQLSLATMVNEIAREHIVIVVTHEPEHFLSRDSSILFLRNNSACWHTTADFIRLSLVDNNYFPLPDWYRRVVAPYVETSRELPMINAAAVFEFIRERS